MDIRLETPRFILRNLTEHDVQDIYELDSDPEVQRYLGNKPIKTIKEAEDIVAYILGQYKQYGIGRIAIIDKKTGEFIGWTGIKYETEVRKDFDYYDLGYRLKRKFWRKGIATETAIESLRFGFEDLKLKEISAGADVNNVGSNKILRRLGMKWQEIIEYVNEPHNWYKITNEEWQNFKTRL